jgi:hypothetical protein
MIRYRFPNSLTVVRFLRAAWLAFIIWTPPWCPGYDAEEPFACIPLPLAWDVAWGIWRD